MPRVFEKPRQTVKEHYSDPSSSREYSVIQAATRDEALLAVRSVAPQVDTIDDVSRFYSHTEIKEHGGGCWDATVQYSKNPDTTELNIDIAAGTVKMTYSKETVQWYDCTGEAVPDAGVGEYVPDFEKGIGYNGKQFDGVDVEIPRLEFTINKKYRQTTLDGAYIATLFKMAQTVNDDDFTITVAGQTLEFKKGSLRFRGARIKQDSDGNFDITYNFVYSKAIRDEDNLKIGKSENIIAEGQYYIWVYYAETTSGGRVVKTPTAAYVERVYDYSTFSDLQL